MRVSTVLQLTTLSLLVPAFAQAHVSIKSGPAIAALSDVVTFGVGHGCESDGGNLDTTSVTIEIPEGVTSVRPELSGFDEISLHTDKTGAVVAVTWTKERALADDFAFYELKLRLKTPDAAFSTLKFPAHQTCTSPDGETEVVVDWVGDEDDADVEPAPLLRVLPAHHPGWNRFTVEDDIDSLEVYFADAEIVWVEKSAFSINPTTMDQIAETEGVSSLSKIKKDSEVWVKY